MSEFVGSFFFIDLSGLWDQSRYKN